MTKTVYEKLSGSKIYAKIRAKMKNSIETTIEAYKKGEATTYDND